MEGNQVITEDDEAALAENDALLMEPREEYDDCMIGIGYRFNHGPLAVYSISKVLKLMEDSGMSSEEAEEFFSFNTLGAWMGDGTPIFMDLLG
jgi:hypothetical protein